jgi:hypothetical protein
MFRLRSNSPKFHHRVCQTHERDPGVDFPNCLFDSSMGDARNRLSQKGGKNDQMEERTAVAISLPKELVDQIKEIAP